MLGWTPWTYVFYLGLFDLVLQLVLGLGMVIWLLEEERQNVIKAAEALKSTEERLRHAQRMQAVGQLAGGVALAHHGVVATEKDFLQKPFTKQKLLSTVRRALHGR